MHNQFPDRGDNTQPAGLFEQLEGLDAQILDDELALDLSVLKRKQEELAEQTGLLRLLENLDTDELPQGLGEIIVDLRQNPELDAGEMQVELLYLSFELPEPHSSKALLLSKIYGYIVDIASVLHNGFKGDAQIALLTDDELDLETKNALLKILNGIDAKGGFDTNNADEVSAMLSAKEAEREFDEKLRRLKEKTESLFAANEQEFLTSHNIHPEDPSWDKLRSLTKGYLMFRFTNGPAATEADRMKEPLDSLGLREKDFHIFLYKLEWQLTKELDGF